MNFLKAKDGRKIKRLASAEAVERTKRHKADDSKINELKQQIMDLADLVPNKITQESVENILAFIKKCKGYLEQNTFKVPDFVFKSKVPVKIQSVSSKSDTSNVKRGNNNHKPQTKLKELSQQKFSYATAAKKSVNLPQKPRAKKRTELTSDQITKIIDGVAPVESSKYKLVYFDGMKRSKITWVKQLLYQSQVRPYFMGNISWVEDSKLEVCVNEKMAPQLISYMESIKGISTDISYSPLNKQSDEITLSVLKERFKWQASDKNRNIPSRRMANIMNKIKPGELSGFKETFLFGYSDQNDEPTEHNSPSAIGDSGGMELSVNEVCDSYRHCKDWGRMDRLLIWNVNELSASSVKRFIEFHTAFQETNLNAKSNRIRLQGYQTVESKSHLRAGGRGLAIGVRKGLGMSISELLQTPHWMVASVSGVYTNSEKMKVFVVNLHMPHNTSRRKLVIKDITKYLRKLCARKKKAKVLLIGDFNKNTDSTIALLNRIGIGLRRAVVRNSKGSRLNGAKIGRMIDHIAYSGFANNPNYAKVLKSVDLSDHLPVVAEWNIESLKSPVLAKRINSAKIKELGERFTSCNRFAVLFNQESNTEDLVKSVTTSIWETSEELSAIKTEDSSFKSALSKETLNTIKRRRRLFKAISKDSSLTEKYSGIKEKAIQLCRKDRRNNRKAEIKKVCDFMLCNRSREVWSWLKRFSGRFRSSLVDGPIFDKNRQLITDSETKAEVWAAHFEELAKDSTGNSRSAEKWHGMGNDSAGVFTECDTPLFWAEICDALKSTPNKKSPGYDGIPSEAWKTVQHEIEPTSPLAKVLFRLIKEIWDNESIPEQLDPSVVVPIPKKGDMREPNNYRGISLIPTLSKVVSKIIARRLCKIENKYDILAKEQAGFRSREECVAQATTLYEVVRRRKISGLSTWIGFIDFAKAYDRVPHEALLKKIRACGIGGKVYRIIEALYRSPKMCVRIGGQLSKLVEYNCGVRQGCPASPILFDIYINDLLDGIKGVKVPGVEEVIPGLLFADDAVVLAESPAELQIALEKLSAWSNKWEMQINQEKCGVMGINGNTGMLFTVMGKPINQVTEYKYLGVLFNDKWNNLSALKNNRENGRKAFHSMYYFLTKKDIPTAMRVSLIRTVLIPILCYGGEIFGMSTTRSGTLQKVANDAARLVAGVGRSTALHRLRNELKIDDIYTRFENMDQRSDQPAAQESTRYLGKRYSPLEEAVSERRRQ
ncbi:LINE-1 retrotransposable element ORF2 protein [Smittium culicis]|uniref:LINE-1 retrotransposable element ORF2 protein n=1 Tax=Smittium culicis TaxID=133412 RepID=A0A1R1YJD8_9FUNG|nr:LINE-1 retrotransposable element ORF2 protein [Smittium culicis]